MREHNVLKYLKAEDLLTLAAAFTSVTAIFLFMDENPLQGIMLLLAAAVIDFFDGMIARKRNVTTEFGRNLDFLQDTITYCVAVAVFIHANVKAPWLNYFLLLLVSASIIRLARQQLMKGRHYVGLPVTFNLALPLIYAAGITDPVIYAAAMTVLSVMMVGSRKMKFL